MSYISHGYIKASGIDTSYYNTCLLMAEQVICMIRVNDHLLFSKEDNYIDALVKKVGDHKFEIEY